MSAFREFVEALGRIMDKRAAGRDGESQAIARARKHLARDPGPRLLDPNLAGFVPGAGDVAGEVYGRKFAITFPDPDTQPLGHVWGLFTWAPDRSGTERPEVRAVCRTCSLAAGWAVSPAACLRSVGDGWGLEDYRPGQS